MAPVYFSRYPLSWLENAELRKAVLSVQGQCVQLKVPSFSSRPPGGSTRGDITEFSLSSRSRMLEKLARIDFSKAGFCCFITLTYPDREGPPSAAHAERDRQTFLKRLKRKFPEASAFWRREWDSRKSGDFIGSYFPHYHLLFFDLPFLPADELNRMWREVIGYEGYVRTEIKAVKSWRQAMRYVSKYMAKPGKAPQSDPRAGEAAVEAGTPPGAEGRSGSLVYVSYLTAGSSEDSQGDKKRKVGRTWGYFNQKSLPLGELKQQEIPVGEWIRAAKEVGHREWGHIDLEAPGGFKLYREHAPKLFDEIAELARRDFPEHWNEDGGYDPIPF